MLSHKGAVSLDITGVKRIMIIGKGVEECQFTPLSKHGRSLESLEDLLYLSLTLVILRMPGTAPAGKNTVEEAKGKVGEASWVIKRP